MTAQQKRLRNEQIVQRVIASNRRNVGRIADEFGLHRRHVDKILRAAKVPTRRRARSVDGVS